MDELSLTTSAADGLGFELLAAALRADLADAHTFIEALAVKLEGALPAQTRVQRARDGLFKSSTHVERIVVELGAYRYALSVGKRGTPEPTRAKIVGGIAIKNEALDLGAWIEALARDLAAFADANADARAALERLVI